MKIEKKYTNAFLFILCFRRRRVKSKILTYSPHLTFFLYEANSCVKNAHYVWLNSFIKNRNIKVFLKNC